MNEQHAEKTMEVLLVGDSLENISLTKEAFRLCRFKNSINVVWEGREALDYIHGRGQYADRKSYPYPQMILFDLQMIKKDCFAVIEELRNHSEHCFIRTMVLSQTAKSEDVAAVYRSGACGYFTR
ncbi:MAG: response regulator, partial [Spirochaetia bacterium]|nr:response regulator [Spirochaetia bacterium]